MTKQQLVYQVADATGISLAAVQLVIDDALDAIQQAVAQGEFVKFNGFGTFRAHLVPARQVFNFNTGMPMKMLSHYTPKFEPSTAFKNKVSKSRK